MLHHGSSERVSGCSCGAQERTGAQVEDRPGDSAHRRGDSGHHACLNRAQVHPESTASVEAEPARRKSVRHRQGQSASLLGEIWEGPAQARTLVDGERARRSRASLVHCGDVLCSGRSRREALLTIRTRAGPCRARQPRQRARSAAKGAQIPTHVPRTTCETE